MTDAVARLLEVAPAVLTTFTPPTQPRKVPGSAAWLSPTGHFYQLSDLADGNVTHGLWAMRGFGPKATDIGLENNAIVSQMFALGWARVVRAAMPGNHSFGYYVELGGPMRQARSLTKAQMNALLTFGIGAETAIRLAGYSGSGTTLYEPPGLQESMVLREAVYKTIDPYDDTSDMVIDYRARRAERNGGDAYEYVACYQVKGGVILATLLDTESSLRNALQLLRASAEANKLALLAPRQLRDFSVVTSWGGGDEYAYGLFVPVVGKPTLGGLREAVDDDCAGTPHSWAACECVAAAYNVMKGYDHDRRAYYHGVAKVSAIYGHGVYIYSTLYPSADLMTDVIRHTIRAKAAHYGLVMGRPQERKYGLGGVFYPLIPATLGGLEIQEAYAFDNLPVRVLIAVRFLIDSGAWMWAGPIQADGCDILVFGPDASSQGKRLTPANLRELKRILAGPRFRLSVASVTPMGTGNKAPALRPGKSYGKGAVLTMQDLPTLGGLSQAAQVPIHPKVQAVLARVKDGVIEGDIDLCDCDLTALPDLSGVRVTGDFDCADNRLTSLQGAPASVGGGFYCSNNRLTNLQGAPTSVGGDFSCRRNRLMSLRGAPASVGGYFDCSYNRLASLQGAPKTKDTFYCTDNARAFTLREVAQARAGRLAWATLGGLADSPEP